MGFRVWGAPPYKGDQDDLGNVLELARLAHLRHAFELIGGG